MEWVNEVYKMCENNEDESEIIDFVYDNIDNELGVIHKFWSELIGTKFTQPDQNSFNKINDIFINLDPNRLTESIQMCYLMITLSFKNNLPSRSIFFDKLKELHKNRPSLLDGLE